MGRKENREEFREPSRRRQGTEADLDPLGSCFPLSPEAISCLDSTSTRQKSSLLVLVLVLERGRESQSHPK